MTQSLKRSADVEALSRHWCTLRRRGFKFKQASLVDCLTVQAFPPALAHDVGHITSETSAAVQ